MVRLIAGRSDAVCSGCPARLRTLARRPLEGLYYSRHRTVSGTGPRLAWRGTRDRAAVADAPPVPGAARRPVGGVPPHRPRGRAPYAYLLGQYLGDGNISAYRGGVQAPDVRLRRLSRDHGRDRGRHSRGDANEHGRACPRHRLHPGRLVFQTLAVPLSTARPWSSASPPIELCPWQEEIALDRYPRQFLRGLIHSDGCRSLNW